VSVLYYFLCKRTALQLADPRFHRDTAWLRQKITTTTHTDHP
jgi:hypothetical protein